MGSDHKEQLFLLRKGYVGQKDGWKELIGPNWQCTRQRKFGREKQRGALSCGLGHCNQVLGTTPRNGDNRLQTPQATDQDLKAALRLLWLGRQVSLNGIILALGPCGLNQS